MNAPAQPADDGAGRPGLLSLFQSGTDLHRAVSEWFGGIAGVVLGPRPFVGQELAVLAQDTVVQARGHVPNLPLLEDLPLPLRRLRVRSRAGRQSRQGRRAA